MKKCLRVCVSLVIAFIFADIASAYQPFPDTGQANFYNEEQEIDCPAPDEPFYGQDK